MSHLFGMPVRPRDFRLPVLVAFVALGLSWLVLWSFRREFLRWEDGRFQRMADRVISQVEADLHSAEAVLVTLAAVQREHDFNTSRTEWEAAVEATIRYAGEGVTGIGFARRIKPEQRDALETAMRTAGYGSYAIATSGNGGELIAITHVAPLATNAAMLGADLTAEPQPSAAAEAAAQSGTFGLSRQIELMEGDSLVPAVLLFYPVFESSLPPATPEERQSQVEGWTYMALQPNLYFADSTVAVSGQVLLQIYQGAVALPEFQLHSSPDADLVASTDFSRDVALTVYGQPWLLRLHSGPAFEAVNQMRAPTLGIGIGLLVSALAGLLTWSLGSSRRRAQTMAMRMMVDRDRATEEAHRLALVASHTVNGVILIDQEGCVTWVNEGFTRLTGYTFDEVRSRRPPDFLNGPDSDPATDAEIAKAAHAGEMYRGEVLHYRKDGTQFWITLEVQPLRNETDEVHGFMAIQTDITAEKLQAVALTKAKEAAEAASVAKSQFLATMSHEIRTPMNGVIGMTSLLLETPLDSTQQGYAQTIRQSGDHLLAVIDDILDFSKIESGRLELEQVPFDVRELVEAVLDLMAPRAAEKGIDLLYEIADGVPQEVEGDGIRIKQILVNLVGNAVKFTHEGEVVLTVRALPRAGKRVELAFAVRDSGIGIPAAARERLFQPFMQVDASTTRRFGGSGLGLAISRRLVELMGGRMTFESEEGVGTTFQFSLQLQTVTGAPPSFSSSSRLALEGRRMLVVDDNATSCRILLDLGSRWGLEVTAVDSGHIALRELAEEPRFDLAIVDMHMPEMDGVELARTIRRDEKLAGIPLIMLSSLGGAANADERSLFAAWLTKPAKPAVIFTAISRLLSGEKIGLDLGDTRVAAVKRDDRTERLLLAEDNLVNRRVAIAMLRKLGFDCDLAGSGLEVVEAVDRIHYDIILMDVHMPDMDGLEATARVREKISAIGGRQPWIIALTANAMRGDREKCLAAGMDDYLSKPIKLDALGAAFEQARTGLAKRDAATPASQ